MTKYNIEEKTKTNNLVKQRLSLGEAARQIGISQPVIRNFMRQADKHGLISLQENRYDWRLEEKLAVRHHWNQICLTTTRVKSSCWGNGPL